MERPILFSTPMVQAILGNRKSKTRRTRGLDEINKNPDEWAYQGVLTVGLTGERFYTFQNKTTGRLESIKCPYGKPGDILWVRETWFENAPSGITRFFYKADEQPEEVIGQMKAFGYKWRPSIHMPRAACRLRLRITDVRIERLQDITEEDAKAEGMLPFLPKFPEGRQGYRTSFEFLWNSLNAKRGHGWDVNPWVWVVSFERVVGHA